MNSKQDQGYQFKEEGGNFKQSGKDYRKKVQDTSKFPYCAVGQIKSYFKNRAESQGTGVVIGNRHVLTVAHNIYSHQLLKDVREAEHVDFIFQGKDNQKTSLKVVKKYYPQQYQTASTSDRRFYDIALLELEQNRVITESQCMKIYWNWVKQSRKSQTSEQVLTVGYPDDLNKVYMKKFYEVNSKQKAFFSHQYEDSCKIIAKHAGFIQYFHSTNFGQSGSPLMILHQGQYKLVGLHQGQNLNLGKKLGILLNNELKTPFCMFKKWITQSKLSQSKQFLESIKFAEDNQQLMSISRIKNSSFGRPSILTSTLQQQQSKIQILTQKLQILQQKYEKLQEKIQQVQEQNSELKRKLQEKQQQSRKSTTQKILIKNQQKTQSFSEKQNNQMYRLKNCRKEVKKDQTVLVLQETETQITDETVVEICQNLLYLKRLIIRSPSLKKIQLYNCKSLEDLMFGYSNVISINLEGFEKLGYLDACKCKRLKEINLSNCKNITSIQISQTQIRSQNVERFIAQLPLLQVLWLQQCLQLKSIKFAKHKHLKTICLRSTDITKLQLSGLQNIEKIYLTKCKKLEHIQINECQSLNQLDLQSTNLSFQQFNKIQKQLPNVQILCLKSRQDNHGILANKMTKIKKLQLSFSKINSVQLMQFCKNLVNLEHLQLFYCKQLTFVELNHCKNIKYLDLSCVFLDNQLLSNCCQVLTNLEQLKFDQNQNIQDFKLKNCYQLKILSITQGKFNSVELYHMSALQSLSTNESKVLKVLTLKDCPRLKQINIRHTQIDERQAEQIQNQYPDLVIKY